MYWKDFVVIALASSSGYISTRWGGNPFEDGFTPVVWGIQLGFWLASAAALRYWFTERETA